jgi:pyridoxamine 5'-phosphate oxidase
MAIADLRREYNLTGLRRKDLAADPIVQFRRWFEQATGARASGRLRKFCIRVYKSIFLIGAPESMDVNAMTLSTADKNGRPSSRVVLLKGLDERGFLFYTNYDSRKGHELTENAQAALVFYWSDLERQVCIAGDASRLPGDESDAYFKTRPHGSQIAAWVSHQSDAIPDRAALEEKWKQLETQYTNKEVPRPPNWGGYVVRPHRIEFWQGRPNRLHDRFRYTKRADAGWEIERLAP